MLHVFSRTEGLSGTEKRKSPDQLKVAVFGIGTVGSYAVEALARAGVGTLILVDYGEVSAKKLNRSDCGTAFYNRKEKSTGGKSAHHGY